MHRRRLDSPTRTVENGDLEYMEWMQNLSLFHQMREKAEEARSKDRMDDYKMQIVRSLMEKNRMMEEIEQKLVRMEEGDDPVQQKILEKIARLEESIERRGMMRANGGGPSDGKVNQMMDYMMYNMSVLQQMVTNVAQMQRAQMEHNMETNRVLESLPQILQHAGYQGASDVLTEKNRSTQRTRTKKEPVLVRRLDDKRPTKLQDAETISSKKDLSSIKSPADGLAKKNDQNKPAKSERNPPKVFVFEDNKQQATQKPSGNRDESEELADLPQKQYLRPINPSNNLIASARKATGVIDSNQFRGTNLKSPNVDSKQPVPGSSVKRVDTNKPQDEDSKDSSVFKMTDKQASIKGLGSLKMTQPMNNNLPITDPEMLGQKNLDESAVLSEGGYPNKSSLDKTARRHHRNESRMKSDVGQDRGTMPVRDPNDPILLDLFRQKSQASPKGMEGMNVLEEDNKMEEGAPQQPQPEADKKSLKTTSKQKEVKQDEKPQAPPSKPPSLRFQAQKEQLPPA
jgi:hypothetical protein